MTNAKANIENAAAPKDIVIKEEAHPLRQGATIFKSYFRENGELYPMYAGEETVERLIEQIYRFHNIGAIEYVFAETPDEPEDAYIDDCIEMVIS